VTAGQLAKLAKHKAVRECPFKLAVWAYLCTASPDLRVALYWD
jgi:hypothetical protein